MFRDDLDEPASVEALEKLSNKKRRARLDAIRDACRSYITGPLHEFLSAHLAEAADGAGRLETPPTSIDRVMLAEKCGPLQRERWTGGIDSVGSTTLANALSQTVRGCATTCCGLAGGGADLPATVLPHILQAVTFIGVDSVIATRKQRLSAWARLARDIDEGKLDSMTTVEPMSKSREKLAAALPSM